MKTMVRRNKLLTFYIFIFLTALVFIFFTSYKIISNRDENRFKQRIVSDAERIVAGADSILSTIEGISFQISMLPILNKVISDPVSTNKYDFMQLREEIGKFIITNKLFKSSYVYLEPYDAVLTTSEGMFKTDEFYDREFLESIGGDNKGFSYFTGRKIKKNYFDNVDKNVISLTKNLPIASDSIDGRLVINIDEGSFYKELTNSFSPEGNIFIIDGSGVILSHEVKELIGRNIEDTYSLDTEEILQQEMGKVKIKNDACFVAAKHMKSTGWSIIELVPYKNFQKQINNTKTVFILIFLGIALVVIVSGYLLINMLGKPLKQLLTRAGNYIKELGLEEESGDEYKVFGTAFEKLVSENSRMNSLIKNYVPVIRDKFISDLLFGNILDEDDFSRRKDSAGLELTYDSYLIVVVLLPEIDEVEDMDSKSYLKLFVKSTIEEAFSFYAKTFGILLDEDRLAFVLNLNSDGNYESLKINLKEKCGEVNEFLKKEIQKKVFFSIGLICTDLEEICKSFLQARKNLEYRALSDEDDIIFASAKAEDIAFPVIIQRQIINGIKSKNYTVVEKAVDRLFEEYFNKISCSHEKMQQIIIVILSHTIGEFLQNNESTAKLSDLDLINSVLNCATLYGLKDKMLQMFNLIIDRMQNGMEEQPTDAVYISKAVRFLSENYMRNIIVEDVATYVNLNPKYLSRIFKVATGKTLLEHLTQLRIKKAKELFSDCSLSIKEISAMIGYKDIHSFMRFFKKYEGITPGEYRDLHIRNTSG